MFIEEAHAVNENVEWKMFPVLCWCWCEGAVRAPSQPIAEVHPSAAMLLAELRVVPR